MTLGVEVTDGPLAGRCGLGNIDPQHGFGSGAARSAIEEALTWPLPPPGATLVTLRPDADALGAMAVLNIRAYDLHESRDVAERAALIGRHDAFANGPWAPWRAARGPLSRPAAIEDVRAAPAQYAALASLAADSRHDLYQRVRDIRIWLTRGKLPTQYAQAADAFTSKLTRAWNDGEIGIECHGGVAVVKSATPGALMLGYRFAPVVLAISGDALPRKVTIAQFDPAHLDMSALARRLNELEPGWGGSATIIGSPQGVGSRLGREPLLAAIQAGLSSRLDAHLA
jgi:hypothetical protein